MKDIKGYEGLYAITEDGQIWSYKSKKFLIPNYDANGYLKINLFKDRKNKSCTIHRLVAETYIPNPNNLSQVNHKDENKTNNHINNLEWCDAKYNMNYGTRTQRASETNRGQKRSEETKKNISEARKNKGNKPVKCIETDIVYISTVSANRETGIDNSCISKCCKGQRKTAGSYHWQYA